MARGAMLRCLGRALLRAEQAGPLQGLQASCRTQLMARPHCRQRGMPSWPPCAGLLWCAGAAAVAGLEPRRSAAPAAQSAAGFASQAQAPPQTSPQPSKGFLPDVPSTPKVLGLLGACSRLRAA